MFFFIMFPFPGYVFPLCFLGGPRRPVARKNGMFSDTEKMSEKMTFFRVRHYGAFWLRCFLASTLALRRWIPYLSANRLEPRINRDQHIQTCQFKTTNVKIHPADPKVYTHLISFGQMEMANASGNFGSTLVGLRAWNDAIHDFRRIAFFRTEKKNVFFSGIWKNAVFSCHGSRMTVRKNPGYLAGCLSGWLALWLAGWLSSWLSGCSGWLAIWQLALWLSGWLFGY